MRTAARASTSNGGTVQPAPGGTTSREAGDVEGDHRGARGEGLDRDHAESLVPGRDHDQAGAREQVDLVRAVAPAEEPDPLGPEVLREPPDPPLLGAAAGDEQLAADLRSDLSPRPQQEVQPLALQLETPEEHHVPADPRRGVEQGGVDAVADDVDARGGVHRAQPLGGALRDRDQPVVAAGAGALDEVQRQLVLAGLVPGVQPLDDADRRAPGPERRGHGGERREEVLDDQVGVPAMTAHRRGQAEHVPREPAQPVAARPEPDGHIAHAVEHRVLGTREAGREHGDLVARRDETAVDLVGTPRPAAGARHPGMFETQVQDAQRCPGARWGRHRPAPVPAMTRP